MTDLADSNWTDAAAAEDLPNGGVKGVKLGEIHVALYRIGGDLHATSDVCTHEFALLSGGWVEDGIIECPLHGARFNIADGRCLGPHGSDLRCFRVRVREGRIEVDLPQKSGK
jgi:nitrite reductase/ring-hydroxylating ferredoxin subunit